MKNAFALLLVVLSCKTATAQIFCPPVFVEPPVIWAPPPPILILPQPSEVWQEVRYCNVEYSLNGARYHVDAHGQHFLLGENSSRQVVRQFVEPFCSFTGRRVLRTLTDVPPEPEAIHQDGPKTVYTVGGAEYFATWIEVGSVIKTVWLKRVALPVLPTPDPAFEQEWQSVPQEKTETREYAPLPAPASGLPELRVPEFPEEEDPFTGSDNEPTPVQPQRYREPIARRL